MQYYSFFSKLKNTCERNLYLFLQVAAKVEK